MSRELFGSKSLGGVKRVCFRGDGAVASGLM